MPLREIKPSAINSWTAGLKSRGYAESTVHATYRRLAQLLADAAADVDAPAEGSASDEADASRGGSEADDEGATK